MGTRSRVPTVITSLADYAWRTTTDLLVESTIGYRVGDVLRLSQGSKFESVTIEQVRPNDRIIVVDRWEENPGMFPPGAEVRTVGHV